MWNVNEVSLQLLYRHFDLLFMLFCMCICWSLRLLNDTFKNNTSVQRRINLFHYSIWNFVITCWVCYLLWEDRGNWLCAFGINIWFQYIAMKHTFINVWYETIHDCVRVLLYVVYVMLCSCCRSFSALMQVNTLCLLTVPSEAWRWNINSQF